jgi:hypothetical protein
MGDREIDRVGDETEFAGSVVKSIHRFGRISYNLNLRGQTNLGHAATAL